MATSETPTPASKLAQFLLMKQLESGKTQNAYLKEDLRLSWDFEKDTIRQIFSKILHGRLKTPPADLVAALAATYPEEGDLKTFRAWAGLPAGHVERPAHSTGLPPIFVLSGHTAWASSLLRGAWHLDDFSVATFTRPIAPGAVVGLDDMAWVSRAGPGAVGTPSVVPRPGGEGLADHAGPRVLSAADVVEILSADRRLAASPDAVVFAALPWDLIQDNAVQKYKFVRVATLLDSPGACVLVTEEVDQRARLGIVSTDAVGQWLTDDRPALFAEPGTVAWTRARAIADNSPGKRAVVMELVTRDLASRTWQSYREEAARSGLTFRGVIAWEPQASWFIARSRETDRATALVSVPLMFAPVAENPPHPLTFDLCIRTPKGAELTTERARQRRWALRRLLTEVLPAIQEQAEALRVTVQERRIAALADLARYFGLTGDTGLGRDVDQLDMMRIILSRLRFRTYPDLLGLDRAGLPLSDLLEVADD